MPHLTITLTDEQNAALIEASRASGLAPHEFVIAAARILAAQYGVEMSAPPPSRFRPSGVSVIPKKTGRPRKPPGEMTRHIPAGYRPVVCAWCHRDFRVDDELTKFCSEQCEISSQQQRIYRRRKARRSTNSNS